MWGTSPTFPLARQHSRSTYKVVAVYSRVNYARADAELVALFLRREDSSDEPPLVSRAMREERRVMMSRAARRDRHVPHARGARMPGDQSAEIDGRRRRHALARELPEHLRAHLIA